MTETQPLKPEQLAILAALTLKLSSLGIDGEFLRTVSEGPVVTLYRFVPKNMTKVSTVEKLAPDMAIALAAEAVQVRRIPGESAIGIYVPNKVKTPLLFRGAVSKTWQFATMNIPLCLGIDHSGNIIVEDLTSLPHLLIAGSTGGGKSTLLNSIIAALIYVKDPKLVRLVLCDPKQVEFSHFKDAINHLLFPISHTTREILDTLEIIVKDVDNRLSTLAKASCQNISQYNERFGSKMPYIVLIIDELAEPLQDQSRDEDEEDPFRKKAYGKQCEYFLGKIAAKARATGIHIIGATQRSSVKVVEGNIKANFPARLSFRLPSETDSRTILNQGGAEQLLSQGDALYLSPNNPAIRRIHTPLSKIEDIQAAIEMAKMKNQGGGF